MPKQIKESVATIQESRETIWEAITKMGERFWELMEKKEDSEEDEQEKEPTSLGLFPIVQMDANPENLSFSTPSSRAMTLEPPITRPFSLFPPIWMQR